VSTFDLDLSKYSLGWSDEVEYAFDPEKGLSDRVVEQISWWKGEPKWMTQYRLRSLGIFDRKPMAKWFADNMPDIDFQDIYYYLRPATEQVDEWDDLPEQMKLTYEKLGIPEAERKYLAGVTAQYESEVVFHRNREDLEKQGILFCDMDTALREYPDLVKQYFGTVIPPGDNKFSALNTAVWSGGSFIYIPPGVECDMPLQAYFRINSENAGQFERTLIIADEGSKVHYIEGCSAPVYTSDSLHSAVVEIVVKPSARVTYTTIQNWSPNVYNLVTKRARVEAEGHMEWIDGNIGSKLTMKYPSVYLVGPKATGRRRTARSSPWRTRARASTRTPARRWCTRPPRPRRRSCRSPSARTAASPRTAVSFAWTRVRTAARATCSATRSSSTATARAAPCRTWRWGRTTPRSATRPPCRRSPTSSSSTSCRAASRRKRQ
jgi:Fe-S cluster assembly protein SufB